MQLKTASLLALSAAAVAVLVSCASYRMEPRFVEAKPAGAERLDGKSLAIEPAVVTLGSPRLAVDLRDVKMTVNGQEITLQTRFIAEDDALGLGHFGVLDVNILKKAKTDVGRLQSFAEESLLSCLDGSADYAVPFFKGFGESNMGQLSNRPVDYDRTVRPPRPLFDASAPRVSLYSKVGPVGSFGSPSDLRLATDISISSEVVQIIRNDSTISPDGSGMPAMAGEYFLVLTGSLRFKLTDSKTGEEIATDKTKSEWGVKPVIVRNIRIPAGKGDAGAYAKYFRSVDLEPYAREAVRGLIESMLPLIDAFYVNTYHAVKAEK